VLQQIAVCAAAGIPPFDWRADDTYEPQRVTILDFENPDHRVKTRLWPMVKDCVRPRRRPAPEPAHRRAREPAEPAEPAERPVAAAHHRARQAAAAVRRPGLQDAQRRPRQGDRRQAITDVLDSIRAMGVAIITEAHHTKEGQKGGTLEPSGSNLWTWWPEFGLGLRIVPGRGD
jgi:hypothetical protein